jgi:outer membrane protein TolC
MNKFLSIILSFMLITSSTLPSYAAVTKSKPGKGSNKDSKAKNIDRVYGEKGALDESKAALVNIDPLALQNYSENDFNYSLDEYDRVTLKSVILETLSHSHKLKSAQEKVTQVELQLKDAYSAYLPTVDFAYQYKTTKNLKTGDATVDTPSHLNIDDENYKITLKQSLYSGGATALKIKSLKAKVEEGKRKYLIVLEQEIQKAIKAYFGVLFGDKNVKINERNMEKLNKILEITQVKYDSGALSIGDLSAVKANIANASGKLIKIKSSLADAIDFYIYTVGYDFEKTAPFEENFNVQLTTLDKLYEDILANNLGLLNYRLNIQSTKNKLLNIKASFKPKVDLELAYKNVLDKEDFKANEESYSAKVTMSLNLYNGGKDVTKTMKVFSGLQELKFRYEEEIKKIKWEVSKLFNSIRSLDKTIQSTKDEVEASNEMVNAYWEGFQLGEQDLQVLLQGQRQLNSAELDLLKYKQDYLTNVFKLLKEKGELSSYFDINPNSPDFLDFSNSDLINPISDDILSTNNEINLTKPKELNATIDEYLEVVKESTFDDIVSFKDKFLTSDDNNYTLVISDFTSHFDAYKYIKTNRMLQNAFSYEYFNKDGELDKGKSKKKTVSVKRNIAYGIFNSEEDARVAKNNIFDTNSQKQFNIVKVKGIKELYGKYIAGLETQIEPFIIKPKIKKTFITDQKFKDKFLKAEKYFFTINIVSFSKVKYAAALVKKEGIEKESLVFRYGRNGEWVKVMYGVFPTYSQAFEALSKHPKLVDKYHPIIEKVEHKQKLYNKYKKYNGLPKWYYEEQKRIKEEAAKKKADEKAKAEAEAKKKIEAKRLLTEEKQKHLEEKSKKENENQTTQKEIDDVVDKKEPQEKTSRKDEAKKLDKNTSSDVNEVILDDSEEVTNDDKVENITPTKIDESKLEAQKLANLEEERKQKEADEQARLEVEEKARLEAEQKAKEEAQRQAQIEADQKTLEEAKKLQEKLEEEKKAKEEAQRLAKLEEERKQKEALMMERAKAIEEAKKLKAQLAEEARQKKEAEEKARLEAEQEEKTRLEAEQKAKEAAQKEALMAERAKAIEEAKKLKAQLAEEARQKREAEEKARLEAEQKAKEERKQKEVAEKARIEAEEKVRLEAEQKAKEKAQREALMAERAKAIEEAKQLKTQLKAAQKKAKLEQEKQKILEEAKKLQKKIEAQKRAQNNGSN